MILYHGSNIPIEEIDFAKCRPYKDFGRGFYLTDIEEQAVRMATRTAKMYKGTPVVTAFDFDMERAMKSELMIKRFDAPSAEWAHFVMRNRDLNVKQPCHNYDIVIGPIADDTVGVQIRRFIMGYLSASALVEELRFRGDHAVQYFSLVAFIY